MSLTGAEYIALSRKVMKKKITNNAKVLYIILLLNSGSADFYVEDISRLLDCSYRTATHTIRELIDANLILKERSRTYSHYEVIK